MNLSKLIIDNLEEVEDIKPKLREREAELVRIIESIQDIHASKEWSTLKKEIFDSLVSSLEKDLKNEAERDDPKPNRLNRISGELKWARRFSDLTKLENNYRLELQRLRTQLYGKSE